MPFEQIQEYLNKYAKIISAPANLFPTFESSEQTGRPHIEVDNKGNLHYVVCERGKEYERKTTKELNELLFWGFQSITHTMAFDYELKHRIEHQDCRIIAFKKQEELLEQINKEWADTLKLKHEKLLAPTEEIKRLRKDYTELLESQGVTSWEAWLKACEKYPA